jgi:MFS family permease
VFAQGDFHERILSQASTHEQVLALKSRPMRPQRIVPKRRNRLAIAPGFLHAGRFAGDGGINHMAAKHESEGQSQAAQSKDPPYPSEGYAWYVVLILMVVYIFSFVDRQVLAYLVGPIKADLNVSDTLMGLLGGTTFAVFYTLFGIPLGRLADSRSRRTIIAVGLFLWSLATAACGLAKTYSHLLIFRIGVGVGEATLSPSAYSMIADYFKPNRLALAISVYGAGIYIGSGIASIVSGLLVEFATSNADYEFPIIGQVRPWQLVFFAIGLPGLVFTAALYTVREPIRRGVAKAQAAQGGAPAAIPFAEVMQYIRANWQTFVCHCGGFAFMSFIGYVGAFWVPETFIRMHDWSRADVGLRYGIAVIIFGSGGIIVGGQLADWLTQRGYKDAKMRVGLAATLIHLPVGIAFPLMTDGWAAFALLIPAIFAIGMPFGVAPAAIQEMMPNQMRGQAAALYLFVVNLIGIGLGPLTVGMLNDFVYGEDRIHYSLATANITANVLSSALLFFGIAHFRRSLDYRDAWLKSQG